LDQGTKEQSKSKAASEETVRCPHVLAVQGLVQNSSHVCVIEQTIQKRASSHVWPIHPDQAVEALARQARNRQAHRIQVKGVMTKIRWKNGRFSYRLETRYVQHWNNTPEPVYLCIVDIEASRVFACNALHFDVASSSAGKRKSEARTMSIPIVETSELTETRFRQIVTEVLQWWILVRFLKGRYSSSGTDPTKRRRLIPVPLQQDTRGFNADHILTSGIFGLVTTRSAWTAKNIERYIELVHAGQTKDTCVELAQIAQELRDMPPLSEDEIRNLVWEYVRTPVSKFLRPPKLLEIVKSLGTLGYSRPVSDEQWLTWMEVSAR
jgi:hypothetical protein